MSHVGRHGSIKSDLFQAAGIDLQVSAAPYSTTETPQRIVLHRSNSGPGSGSCMASETSQDIKLQCRSVWKLFGEGAGALLQQSGGSLDEEALTEAGLIGAVCDVNLEVREGEIFVIMGLFRIRQVHARTLHVAVDRADRR